MNKSKVLLSLIVVLVVVSAYFLDDYLQKNKKPSTGFSTSKVQSHISDHKKGWMLLKFSIINAHDYKRRIASNKITDEDRMELVEEFLYKWANVAGVDEKSRGEYVNAKHLAVLEKLMQKKFFSNWEAKNGKGDPTKPNIVAGQMLETAYQNLKAVVFVEFVSDIFIKDLKKDLSFGINIHFFEKPTKFMLLNEFDTSKFETVYEKLEKELVENPELAKQRIFYLGALLKMYKISKYDVFNKGDFYNKFIEPDRELKWKIDSLGKIPYDLQKMDPSKQGDEAVRIYQGVPLRDFHARRGKDVIYGDILDDYFIGGSGDDILDGGDGNDELFGVQGDDIIWGGKGNDTIYGGEAEDIIIAGDGDDVIYPDRNESDIESSEYGNDTIVAGKGNDTVYSELGNDTYIYRYGDGNDIIEDKSGDDVIYFDMDESPTNFIYSRNRDDLVIGFKNTDNFITIKNWFKSDSYKIEEFKTKASDSKYTWKHTELFEEDNL